MVEGRKKQYITRFQIAHENQNFDKACKEIDILKEKIIKNGYQIQEVRTTGPGKGDD